MAEMWFVGNIHGKHEFKKHVDVLVEKHKQVTVSYTHLTLPTIYSV